MQKRAMYLLIALGTIVAGLSVVFLAGDRLGLKSETAASASKRPPPYLPGEAMTPMAGVDYHAADRTVLIFIRSTCNFCIRSVPFYQRLVTVRNQRGVSTQIIGAALTSDKGAEGFPAARGWSPDRMIRFDLGQVKVKGVPTILVVDRQGKVQETWFGQLSEQQQGELMTAAGLGAT